jgi:hypothetical protein
MDLIIATERHFLDRNSLPSPPQPPPIDLFLNQLRRNFFFTLQQPISRLPFWFCSSLYLLGNRLLLGIQGPQLLGFQKVPGRHRERDSIPWSVSSTSSL